MCRMYPDIIKIFSSHGDFYSKMSKNSFAFLTGNNKKIQHLIYFCSIPKVNIAWVVNISTHVDDESIFIFWAFARNVSL